MIDRMTLIIRARNAAGRTTSLFSTSHLNTDATNENVLDLAEAVQALQDVPVEAGEQEVLKSTLSDLYNNK